MPNFPVCFHNLAYNTGTPTQYNILMQICIVILNLVHLTYPPVVTHFSYLTDQDIFLAIQTSTFHTSHIYYSILLSPFLFNAFVSVFCTSLVSTDHLLYSYRCQHSWGDSVRTIIDGKVICELWYARLPDDLWQVLILCPAQTMYAVRCPWYCPCNSQPQNSWLRGQNGCDRCSV